MLVFCIDVDLSKGIPNKMVLKWEIRSGFTFWIMRIQFNPIL